jgi:putative ABC transport system permease protein
MGGWLLDLRHGARAWRRRPGAFVLAAGALALGIGGTAALFAVVDAVLLRPLPFERPDRLVLGWQASPERSQPFVEVCYPDYEAWRQARTLSAAAIMPSVNQRFTIRADEPVRVQGRLVSGGFFEVLGARAWRGRALEPADDSPGAPRVAVVSHGLWRRLLGGDPAAVGRTIVLDEAPVTVVGVMPPGFEYPPDAEIWTPVVPALARLVDDPAVHWGVVVGRIAEGASIDEARAELETTVGRLSQDTSRHGASAQREHAVLTPLAEHLVGASRPALWLLMGAVALVLVIACANVSALLLARAAERRREAAVRLALGASRARLVRALASEAVVVALAGGLGGVLLAFWGVESLKAIVPAEVPRLELAAVDARVLAASVLLTTLAALGAGALPALVASRASLTTALADGSRGAGEARGRGRLRALLLAGQSAAAVALLAGAGLLVESFRNLRAVELGYDPRGVLTLEVAPARGSYGTPARRRALYASLVDRVDALPGVEGSAAVLLRPLWGTVGLDCPFRAEGQSEAEARLNPTLNLEAVTPRYFDVMRIPIVRGRAFTDEDTERSERVAIVSAALARRVWPGRDPLGKRLSIPLPPAPYADVAHTVVGVAGDARYRELQGARHDLYLGYLQSEEPLRHLVVRAAGDPRRVAAAVRSAVRGVDPALAVDDVTTMEAVVDRHLGASRFRMQLLAAFASFALFLTALGLHGVMAFVVGQRTREIGLRMALGARAAQVAGLVLRQALLPVAAGLAAGLVAALAAGRAIEGLLYGVAPHDPRAAALAAALLLAAAGTACALPARRALRVDPALALRDE